MREFSEKYIFDLGANGLGGGPQIVAAFVAFEGVLVRAFRAHELTNSPVRPDESDPTYGE
jgi:hypothetical protein